MLTKDEILELYEEINQPYSDEEFAKHSENRLIKSWLEITHAHNFDLINLTKQWNDYFFNGGEKPARKLWVMLRPGKNNDNAACARLHDMANYFAQFEHGSVPRLPIIVYVSRSSLTLISRLEDFFYSPHLLEANNHIKNFFCLLAYDGEPQMTKEEFRKALFDEIDGFISECSKHADALGDYIFDRLDELRKGEKLIKVQVVKQATKQKTAKKPSLGKGPQTDFKLHQRNTFEKFLERKPITLSFSKITRAHQCWDEHKKEWDMRAKDGTGYYDYKKLARSI